MTPAPPKPQPASAPEAAPVAKDPDELLTAPLGLRERKKLKTRRAIRAAAFRLFGEQGYEATTVDQIAELAEISPSTFFRYFPAKEDLVVNDDYDPVMEAALRARPQGEPLMESMRQTVLPALRVITDAEREGMVLRLQLLDSIPTIRNRAAAELLRTRDTIVAILVERSGQPADDLTLLDLRAVVAAMLAACGEAVHHWARNGGQGDVADLCERALTAVAGGFTGS